MKDDGAADRASSSPLVVCAGLIVADLFVPPLQRLPEPGELVMTSDLLPGAGGCAVNTATTLVRLRVSAALAAKVGSDALGEQLRNDLAASGVDVGGVSFAHDLATSQTIIVPVVGEDRRYIHSVGANADLTSADIARVVIGARILAVGGFLALPGLQPAELSDLFARARAAGTRTVLDVVIPQGTVDPVESLRPVLPLVDCFLPNQDEALVLTGKHDPVEQAEILRGWGCSSVIITCGAEGALYVDADRTLRVLPLPIEFVDGSGAGDAFTAGIILGLLEDWPVEQRLRFAAAVGASVCRGLGCNTTVFTREEALAAVPDVPLFAVPNSKS